MCIIQDSAQFLGPYLNVCKLVILIIFTALYKRSGFPHAGSEEREWKKTPTFVLVISDFCASVYIMTAIIKFKTKKKTYDYIWLHVSDMYFRV